MNATARSLLRQLTPERGFDLIRIYLGLGLAVRGVLFLLDPSWIGNMLQHTMESQLAPRLRLRVVPELVFKLDRGAEHSQRITDLLESLNDDEQGA